MRSWTALVILSACSSSTPPPQPVAEPEPAAATPPAVATDSPAASGCAAADAATWPTCSGQPGSLRGRMARDVYNHPDLRGFDPAGGESFQHYVDVGERQVVVISSAPAPDCGGDVRVDGQLDWYDMGGPEGTPQSYANLVVRGATLRCE